MAWPDLGYIIDFTKTKPLEWRCLWLRHSYSLFISCFQRIYLTKRKTHQPKCLIHEQVILTEASATAISWMQFPPILFSFLQTSPQQQHMLSMSGRAARCGENSPARYFQPDFLDILCFLGVGCWQATSSHSIQASHPPPLISRIFYHGDDLDFEAISTTAQTLDDPRNEKA